MLARCIPTTVVSYVERLPKCIMMVHGDCGIIIGTFQKMLRDCIDEDALEHNNNMPFTGDRVGTLAIDREILITPQNLWCC